jgi:acetyl-CoA C-acetyltransferase
MSSQLRPVIVAARRSPIGTTGHGFARLTAADLAAPVLAAVAADLAWPADQIGDVVLGNCMGPGGNLARVAALQAGLPPTVPGLTVDRQCASGLAAVAVADALIAQGASAVLAGGVESASTAPWRCWPPDPAASPPRDQPERYHRAPFAPTELGDPDMDVAADVIAAEAGVGRARQDVYAARSHAAAYATHRSGGFAAELVQVGALAADERPRATLTPQRLSRLRPLNPPDGTVTAGNSCGVNDGAAAVAVVDGASWRLSPRPGLRIVATATAGVDPGRPGLGIVPAAQQALAQARLGWADLAAIEFNEAFAGQVLACCDQLGLDEHRVCVQGGALALGHPWGASGAVLLVRLFAQLTRKPGGGGGYGLAAIAAGGGQGVAMVVQACG